ncbi:MAG: flavin reductase family protein [Acidimicrobiales bacterium]
MSDQDHPEHAAIDPDDFRRVLGHLPTGVTVVTANGPDGPVGVAIGSFASISLDPPLVGFFLGVDSSSRAGIEAAGHYTVNILTADQGPVSGVMASKEPDKFDGIDHSPAPYSGAPVLPQVHAMIDCSLDQVITLGDHVLMVGRVQHLTSGEESEPMVFYKGSYGSFRA